MPNSHDCLTVCLIPNLVWSHTWNWHDSASAVGGSNCKTLKLCRLAFLLDYAATHIWLTTKIQIFQHWIISLSLFCFHRSDICGCRAQQKCQPTVMAQPCQQTGWAQNTSSNTEKWVDAFAAWGFQSILRKQVSQMLHATPQGTQRAELSPLASMHNRTNHFGFWNRMSVLFPVVIEIHSFHPDESLFPFSWNP